MPLTPAERAAVDRAFLGLEPTAAGARFVVEKRLARPDGRLFGGAAIAVSVAAVELGTGREALWSTCQLTGAAPVGATVELAIDELAKGYRASQVRVTASIDGEIAFVALGAAATLKPEADALTALVDRAPQVTPVDDAPVVFQFPPQIEDTGWHDLVEMRLASAPGALGEQGRMCLWIRYLDAEPMTAARLAFIADVVPLAIARATGTVGAGTSLDNTIRLGHLVDTTWVLLDLRGHIAWGGYGTGTGVLFAEDGHLMAVASQTASVIELPWDPLGGH